MAIYTQEAFCNSVKDGEPIEHRPLWSLNVGRSRGYKIFMLNLIEHGIYLAHKCQDVQYMISTACVGIFNIYKHDKYNIYY